MTSIKIFLLLFLPTIAFAQSEKSFVKNWTSHPIPESKQTNFLYSENFPFVYIKEGEIMTSFLLKDNQGDKIPFKFTPSDLREQMTMKGKKSIITTNDGYLIGFDNGEFGGSLYWFSKDGKQRYLVSNRNIVQLIKRNDRLYAIEGLCHMGTDAGSILLISMSEGKWIANEYIKLPYAPMAIGLDSDKNFIIATSSTLLSIDANATFTVFEEYAKWQPIASPTSMVLKNDIVYVAMTEGIYKLNLKTKKAEWLLPNQ